MSPDDSLGDPLFRWDASSAWWNKHCWEASQWAEQHIRDAEFTFIVDFYLIDVPFAVCYRFSKPKRLNPATLDIDRDDPVIQILDELPPDRLLRD